MVDFAHWTIVQNKYQKCWIIRLITNSTQINETFDFLGILSDHGKTTYYHINTKINSPYLLILKIWKFPHFISHLNKIYEQNISRNTHKTENKKVEVNYGELLLHHMFVICAFEWDWIEFEYSNWSRTASKLYYDIRIHVNFWFQLSAFWIGESSIEMNFVLETRPDQKWFG